MSGVFPVLIGLAMAAVLVVLVFGVLGMLRGGAFNRRHSNRLMRLRVFMQFAAVILIALAFMFRDG